MTPNDAPILFQSVRWGENYVSRALNIKAAGIIPTGIYHGYQVKPCGDMAVLIDHDEDYPRSVAVVERDAYSLTVIMDDPGKIAIPAPGDWFICIEAFYNPAKQGYQRVVARQKAETHHVILATVSIPAEASIITEEMISYLPRHKCVIAENVLETLKLEMAQAHRSIIKVSDLLTRESLKRIELDNALRTEIEQGKEREADRQKREASQARISINILDRLTSMELAFYSGKFASFPLFAPSMSLSPEGYDLYGGAKVAPLTILHPGDIPPFDAAIVLKLEKACSIPAKP